MTGRALIDYIINNNLQNHEFYFDAADDHECILPIDEQFIRVRSNQDSHNIVLFTA